MKRKPGKPKRKSLFSFISKFITIAAVIGCFASIIITQSNRAEINKKAEEIEAENVELQRILEDDDMDAYMEKLAIEKMNYAYPDERRYYDTSRN